MQEYSKWIVRKADRKKELGPKRGNELGRKHLELVQALKTAESTFPTTSLLTSSLG